MNTMKYSRTMSAMASLEKIVFLVLLGVAFVLPLQTVHADGGGGFYIATCPNGILDVGEQCDDGNYTNGDGCSSLCMTETGGTPPPAPSASITASPNSVSVGAAATISWSSSNATSCAGTGFSTGGAPSGSVSTGALAAGTYSYTVSCTGAGGTAYASASVTSSAAGSSCTSGTCTQVCVNVPVSQPSVAQVSAEDGSVGIAAKQIVFSFTAVQTNNAPTNPVITGQTSRQVGQIGDYQVVATDPDGDTLRYLIDWNMDGSADQILPGSGYVASGNAQATQKSWASSGTATFQAKAEDSRGGASGWVQYTVSITAAPQCSDGANNDNGEDILIDWPADPGCTSPSDTTESPNPPPPLSADLVGIPLTVRSGQSALLTWTSNADRCDGTGFNTGGAANNTVGVSTGPLTFATCPTGVCSYQATCTRTIAQNDSQEKRASEGMSAVAGTESVSDTVNITVLNAAVDLTATPDRVPVGGTVQLSWSGSQVSSCTGTGFSTGGAISGTTTSSAITGQTTFRISCDNGAATNSVIVNVVPKFEEF